MESLRTLEKETQPNPVRHPENRQRADRGPGGDNERDCADIADQARREGVLDLRQAGLLKVKTGITSLEEVEAVTNI